MTDVISQKQAPSPQDLAAAQKTQQEMQQQAQLAAIDFQLRVTCFGQASQIFQGTSTDSSNVTKMAHSIYKEIVGKEWKQG